MRPISLALLAVAALFAAMPAAAHAERTAYSRKDRREAQRTVIKLLDEAREQGKISRGQRARLGLMARFNGRKCCEVLEAAAPEFAALEGHAETTYGSADNGESDYYSEGGLYRLDIGKLEQLFELLLKYLPQFLDLFQNIFPA